MENLQEIKSMQGKKVLITGGLGFIGSNLAKRLVGEGAEVTLFDKVENDSDKVKNIADKLKIVKGDNLDKQLIDDIIKEKDYIFHFAWQTDLKESMIHPGQDITRDIIGLIIMLESCRKYNKNVKIIFASSVTVAGEIEKIPAGEDVAENPLSIYEANKLAAEKYLYVYFKNYGLKTCVLRLANVFGEGQRIDNPNRGVLNFMIGRALRGEPLTVYGNGEFIRDYTYVQNYIDAFILAALSDKTDGEFYVLGSGKGLTMNEVVHKIKEITREITGKDVLIEQIPFPESTHKIDKRNFIADYSKFKQATGWQPKIDFEWGLRKTIEFYYINSLKTA